MALITDARQAENAQGVLTVLSAASDGLRAGEVVASLMSDLTLTEAEQHRYERGTTRFEVYLRFISTTLAKADFIRKVKGRWYITEEGLEYMNKPARAIYAAALQKYSDWKSDRKLTPIDLDAQPQISTEEEIELSLERAEETALEEIRAAITSLGAYAFQDLVAALLRGMGYRTPFVAPRGPDGGTDILAYLDPLGAQTPHIRVQVKHRQDRATNAEIASLQGNINPLREIGLFVSSGGFTREARNQMMRGQAHLELIDMDQLIGLWIDHYASLSDADKSLLPLRPVYFLAPSKQPV